MFSSVIVDELARSKGTLLQRSDDTNHHIRLLLHERQLLFSMMLDNLRVVSRLKNAFDPLSVASLKDPSNKSTDNITTNLLKENECISLLGLAEFNLNTGKILKERLLGNTENLPKELTENLKSSDELVKLQMDSPAEEGLRQVNTHFYRSCKKLKYKFFLPF